LIGHRPRRALDAANVLKDGVSDDTRYASVMNRIAFVWLAAALIGCAPRPVSPTDARLATPASVTLANPAGDAKEPEDAALTRLLEERALERTDRWQTVGVALPDAPNWRRIRVFGHPTRVAYRYGDDHLAIDALEYRPSEGDDSPEACLRRFENRALESAAKYGITFDAILPGHGQHPRGVEAIDWSGATRRRLALAAVVPRPRLLPASPVVRHVPDAPRQSESSAVGPQQQDGAMPDDAGRNQPEVNRPKLAPPRFSLVGRPGSPLGFAPMPSVRSGADVVTFFRRHRYVGAVAAHQSWPGTCLIRAFAARVGTDEALAQRVVDRWLAELAPRTRWSTRLRRAPRFEDR
jgi:hypothetical protein